MPAKRTLLILAALLGLILPGCGGSDNPLLGKWNLDYQDESSYVRMGISLATSGKNFTVTFGEKEMRVDYGRGEEVQNVTYLNDPKTKSWLFCLNEGRNCFPAIFSGERQERVVIPLYGVEMKLVRAN
jgi:hypothetical protein